FSIFAIRLAELNAAALLDVVARVHRQLADDIAGNHRLTPEPRVGRQAPRRIEPIRLIVFHLGEVLRPLTDDDVAGCAGAAAAAGVLERHATILGHVEKRLRLAMVRIRQPPRFEFHGLRLAVDDEGDFRHDAALYLVKPSRSRSVTFFPDSAAWT